MIATGADMRPEEIPGLAEHAETIWTPKRCSACASASSASATRARRGERSRVLFLVPPNNKCAGPLYEMVFMLETWLRREGVRDQVDITYSTFEQTFIQAFGPRLHEVVTSEFAERGIEGHTDEVVTEVSDGEVRYADGGTREFDLLISFPPYVVGGDATTGFRRDDRGFLQTELETRQVEGPRGHLRARRRGRLPGQAGVPRVPAGRRRRRAHRREPAGARSSSRSTR